MSRRRTSTISAIGPFYYFDADDFNSNISVLFPCLNAQSCIDRVDTQNTGVCINTVTGLADRLSSTVGVRNSDDEKTIALERFDRLRRHDGAPLGHGPCVTQFRDRHARVALHELRCRHA